MYVCEYVMDSFFTTVQLDIELYTQFKEINVRGKISFQDFVNKCLEKYIEDSNFRKEISDSLCQKLSYDQPFQLSTPNKDKK